MVEEPNMDGMGAPWPWGSGAEAGGKAGEGLDCAKAVSVSVANAHVAQMILAAERTVWCISGSVGGREGIGDCGRGKGPG